MDRAVFGVPMDGAGMANFGGIEGGQSWLPGSDPALTDALQGRPRLQAYFPLLAKASGASSTSETLNGTGVVHIHIRPGGTYVVHSHQPRYSGLRSIPLWMCARVAHDQSSRIDEYRLAQVVQRMRAISEGLELGTARPEHFLRDGGDHERVAIANQPAPLECLRAGCVAYEHLTTGTPGEEVPDHPLYWLAIDRLVEASMEARAPGTSDAAPQTYAFILERNGLLDWSGPPDRRPRELRAIIPTFTPNGRKFRGVSDIEMLAASPGCFREAHGRMATALVHVAHPPSSVATLIDPLVPLHLVPEHLLDPSELKDWGRAVQRHAQDFKGRLLRLVDEALAERAAGIRMRDSRAMPRVQALMGALLEGPGEGPSLAEAVLMLRDRAEAAQQSA